MLTRRWLPGGTANAIEANQAEFRAGPEIPVRRLGDRVDIAKGEPVPDPPRGACVLADLQRWVQRQGRRRPQEKTERANRDKRESTFHLRPCRPHRSRNRR